MSAPKMAVDCFVYPDASGRIDVPETCQRITDYAAEKVREATEALKAENADLRVRMEAIRKAWDETGGFFEADFETLLDSAFDLTRPFKEDA